MPWKLQFWQIMSLNRGMLAIPWWRNVNMVFSGQKTESYTLMLGISRRRPLVWSMMSGWPVGWAQWGQQYSTITHILHLDGG